MSTVETTILIRLRTQLREAIKDLVDEVVITTHLDDGSSVINRGPSLLVQLTTCITNNQGGSGQGKNSSNRLLISLAAFDLNRKIEKEWRKPGETLERSLRGLPEEMATCTDLDKMRVTIKDMLSIARAIRMMLDPPRKYHVAAACPVCTVRMVRQWDQVNSEYVQVPALTLDGINGCICLACGATWAPDHLEHLALVLGCDPIGDTLPTSG